LLQARQLPLLSAAAVAGEVLRRAQLAATLFLEISRPVVAAAAAGTRRLRKLRQIPAVLVVGLLTALPALQESTVKVMPVEMDCQVVALLVGVAEAVPER
jgi:hypothetical protein